MADVSLDLSLSLPEPIGKALASLPTARIESALQELVIKLAEPPPAVDSKQVEFRRAVSLSKADASEHYALMVVLEPETPDSQKDVYDADTIQKACWRFMEAYRSGDREGHMGVMHKRLADDELAILESYLCPTDCTIGGQVVKKGTWLMGLRVKSEKLWDQVQKGEMTGLSIGGTAVRTPVAGS